MGANVNAQDNNRPRARDIGIQVGILPPGPMNAITDVEGVKVGHQTLWRGEDVRTGVTVILPHGGNLFQEKVAAAIYAGNGHGKLAGSTQVDELGNIETPIGLTNTLNVGIAVQALVRHALGLPGNEDVVSVNAVVGETNDSGLNAIRGFHVDEEDVLAAIEKAVEGPAEEGCVGAGTGTSCFGFKGGIGTSSRRLPAALGGYTVGALVQSNYGGILTVNGAPVGRELGRFAFSEFTKQDGDGSCMVVVSTDAPLFSRNLKRLARRSLYGLARTGSYMGNGSGDYSIAFSTGYRISYRGDAAAVAHLPNDDMNALFLGVIEATEEAVYNSMLKATTVTGKDGRIVEAIPVDEVVEICERYGVLNLQERLSGIEK